MSEEANLVRILSDIPPTTRPALNPTTFRPPTTTAVPSTAPPAAAKPTPPTTAAALRKSIESDEDSNEDSVEGFCQFRPLYAEQEVVTQNFTAADDLSQNKFKRDP